MATITEREKEVLRLNEVVETEESLRGKIRHIVRELLGLEASMVLDDDDDIMAFGMDSLSTISFVSELRNLAKVTLRPSLLFDFPTISSLARAILDKSAEWEERTVETGVAAGRRIACTSLTQLVAATHAKPPPKEQQPEDIYQKFSRFSGTYHRYQRATDGMQCVEIPGDTVWVGDGLDGRAALPNEQPCHQVSIQSFLIDVEPVSAGAYARFLNSVRAGKEHHADWIGLRPGDLRMPHMPLYFTGSMWRPKEGFPAEWPMIMVSWYGANAYSLWANGHDWRGYRDASQSFLPTEAQWEYAARGLRPTNFPWGDGPATEDLMVFCPEERKLDPEMRLQDFPLKPVNAELGVSPFGVRGMAGNVWQWCRDTYDPEFYKTPEASSPDAWNSAATGLKSERGGSWVGPASVARSSYRRGRNAGAKGRCLGFRCVGSIPGCATASVHQGREATPEDLASTEANSALSDTVSMSSEPCP